MELESSHKQASSQTPESESSRKQTASQMPVPSALGSVKSQDLRSIFEILQKNFKDLRKDFSASKEYSETEQEEILNFLSILKLTLKKFDDSAGEKIDKELFVELKKILAANQKLFESCNKWKEAYGQLNVEYQIFKRNYNLSGWNQKFIS